MKSFKKYISSLILFNIISVAHSCTAQVAEKKAPINWISFEQAAAKNDTAQKKVFIDAYTHWCGWCKRMDATTFRDSAVVKYMNDKFHAVKLDAETKDTIQFNGNKFVYKPENKANELAISLMNGQMSYPTFIFLDEQFGMLSPLPGYQTPEQLMVVLKYFGEDIYKTKKWEEYEKETRGN
jgi:thioredoxin-related protein